MPKELVIIFGAGATRGAFAKELPPPPVDKDFFEIAGQLKGRGTAKLAARVINDVFELYGRVNGVGLEQYFQDVETRAEIGDFAKSQQHPKNWKKRQSDLEELIRRVMLHTTCDLESRPTEVRRSNVHRDVLEKIQPNDTLITFNYDTVIEESFPTNSKIWTPDDGYGSKARGRTQEWARHWKNGHKRATTKSGAKLLKLHGSLNWKPGRSVTLKKRPYLVKRKNKGGEPDKSPCSILAPGWHKKINSRPFRNLWREARLKLERCSALAIVGYSLPDTDFSARALFAEVCRMRAARQDFLKYLYLADPLDSVKDRFVDMFVPALGARGRVFRFSGIAEMSTVWQERGIQR